MVSRFCYTYRPQQGPEHMRSATTMVRSAIATAATLLFMCALAAAEESDGTAMTSVKIAGFDTTHDVTEHSFIDKDVKDIEDALSQKDYEEAENIYKNGKNSKMQSAMRTLADFWPGMHQNTLGLSSSDEPFLKMFDAYEKATRKEGQQQGIDPHDSVVAALAGGAAGETHERLGDYRNSAVVGTDAFREQVVKKNIKFQVIMLYALHELEIAVAAYKKAQDAGDGPSEDAQRYVDVWWAFYAGSMETGNGQGFSTYVLAERRAKFFGTDKAEIGNGGKSKVNEILLKATNEMKRLMRANGNTAAVQKLMKCVRAQLKVPLIQGCIQYGYKTDPKTAYDPGNDFITETGYNSEFARKGELWSFCSGVLPFLHAVDADEAQKLLDVVDVDQDVIKKIGDVQTDVGIPSWEIIKAVFSKTNLNKMGVKCVDVGGFVDQDAGKTSATTRGSDFIECQDGTLSNSDADSGECSGSWMEKAASIGPSGDTSATLDTEGDSQSAASSASHTVTFSLFTLFAGSVLGLLGH